MSATPSALARIATQVKDLAISYKQRPVLDLSLANTDPQHALERYLLFYLMPIWNVAGVLDWYWHKSTDIEHTAGIEESLIHMLMFTEVGAPIFMGLLLEINAGVLAAMAAALAIHEATAFWDVSYATDHRHVKPNEQHTHSFLEVLPFMALSIASILHWDQVQALFGVGEKKPDWRIRLKKERMPTAYFAAITALLVGGIAIPYGNELLRCWRARNEPKYDGGCTAPQRP